MDADPNRSLPPPEPPRGASVRIAFPRGVRAPATLIGVTAEGLRTTLHYEETDGDGRAVYHSPAPYALDSIEIPAIPKQDSGGWTMPRKVSLNAEVTGGNRKQRRTLRAIARRAR